MCVVAILKSNYVSMCYMDTNYEAKKPKDASEKSDNYRAQMEIYRTILVSKKLREFICN